MDQAPRPHRFRFGLRSLLLLVAISAIAVAIYRKLAPSPLSATDFGMTEAEVRDQLGPPQVVVAEQEWTDWYYRDEEVGAFYYVRFSTLDGIFPELRLTSVGWAEEEPHATPNKK